jgi:hypothetical protein
MFPLLLPLLSAGVTYATTGDIKSALLGGLLGALPGLGAAAGAGAGAAGAAQTGATALDALSKAGQLTSAAATAAPTAASLAPTLVAEGAKAAAIPGLSTAAATGASGIAKTAMPGLVSGAYGAPSSGLQAIGDALKQSRMTPVAPPEPPGGVQGMLGQVNDWAQNNKLKAAMLASSVAGVLGAEQPDQPGKRDPIRKDPHTLDNGEYVPYTGVDSTQPSTYGLDANTNPNAYNKPDRYSQMGGEHVFIPSALKDNWMADVQGGAITDPDEERNRPRRGGIWDLLGERWETRGRAGGGPVMGPGTTTSDSIPAATPDGQKYALSKNEHIVPAFFVKEMGGGDYDKGHAAIMRQVEQVRRNVYGRNG